MDIIKQRQIELRNAELEAENQRKEAERIQDEYNQREAERLRLERERREREIEERIRIRRIKKERPQVQPNAAGVQISTGRVTPSLNDGKPIQKRILYKDHRTKCITNSIFLFFHNCIEFLVPNRPSELAVTILTSEESVAVEVRFLS